ncbi:WhiB family transcriptional regulator, redox-sensing transcriptional regulator [Jatrophihabitans endophyticus]|uniref:Transcriptional regulator WhiB n=1 Tax=Jatrophihabitans endophyticus TaxID=1206085 RepID=A0A1M5GFK0_9ACTN|nr:WhiB family transcriptional regulator [Jatrophihabitans endophyticus]SHG02504.1 WhiB family transcriptional regulator, redox-sensing transcriptional regulator [Jatrophihabitans endophyticus]
MGEIRRLPELREGDWDWQMSAACRGQDTATFYHPENERGPSRARREMQAKAVCSGCPVVQSCLRWALAAREPYGVWGGLSVEERERLITARSA